MYHSSDDDDDDDSGNSSDQSPNLHRGSPGSTNTPSFATNASPISTPPPSASNPTTPTHRARHLATADIVALILQGENQRTPLCPEEDPEENQDEDPDEHHTEPTDSPNQSSSQPNNGDSPSYVTPRAHVSSPDSSDEIGQMQFERDLVVAAHNSMQDDGLPSNLPLPAMDGVIKESYYEE
ncbi:hypothetical protein LIER_20066 [Lithospermum erythrorhizon]|uniref:Uncharacterized protein n=1 Tax=Lithospermum erythrorhizon TaxID=34254 RepID=A0AAV3QL27_LITER